MLEVLQVLTLILVVVGMVPAVAHALELPGKLRLTKDAYVAVQPIYYPGFTVAGICEPLSIAATIALLLLTPRHSMDFWLTLGALLGLAGMHAVYWLFTHPVNNFWLQDEKLGRAGSRFFSLGAVGKTAPQRDDDPADWAKRRDRWEYSHVARAVLAFCSFVALTAAISC